MDGNFAGNCVTGIGGTYTPASTIPAGATFYLRWKDPDDASSDHALAIDDFSITITLVPTPQYWDVNGSIAGTGGPGTWDTATANWNPSSAGTGTPQTFNSANEAIFGGTAGTVDIDVGGVTANAGLEFDVTGYTVQTGPLTLGSGSFVSVTTGGDSAAINSKVSGANGLVKNGSGTLVLGAANDYTGNTDINGGTLSISSDGNLGNTANDITLNGATLQATASVNLDAGRDLTGTGTLDIGS